MGNSSTVRPDPTWAIPAGGTSRGGVGGIPRGGGIRGLCRRGAVDGSYGGADRDRKVLGGELADGVIIPGGVSPEEVRASVGHLRAQRGAGRGPAEVVVFISAPADSPAACRTLLCGVQRAHRSPFHQSA